MTPMNVEGGYVHCPTCNGLIRITSKLSWGLRIARHLAQGSWCSQGEEISYITEDLDRRYPSIPHEPDMDPKG